MTLDTPQEQVQDQDKVSKLFGLYKEKGIFSQDQPEENFRKALQSDDRRKLIFEEGKKAGLFSQDTEYEKFDNTFSVQPNIKAKDTKELTDQLADGLKEMAAINFQDQNPDQIAQHQEQQDKMVTASQRYFEADGPDSYLSAIEEFDTIPERVEKGELTEEEAKEEQLNITSFLSSMSDEDLQGVQLEDIPKTNKVGREVAVRKLDLELDSKVSEITGLSDDSEDYAFKKGMILGGYEDLPEDTEEEVADKVLQRRALKNRNLGAVGAIASGIEGGVRVAPMMSLNGVATFAEFFSSEESGPVRDAIYSITDKWAKEQGYFSEGDDRTLEQVFSSEDTLASFVNWAAYNLGNGLATSIPIVAAGMVNAPLMMATSYMMGVGDIHQDQRDRGIKDKEWAAIVGGIPYAAAERILGLGGQAMKWVRPTKVATSVLSRGLSSKAVKQGIGQSVKAGAKALASSSLKEGAEEGLQDGVFVKLLNDSLDDNVEAFSTENLLATLKTAGESAAAGAVGGLGFAGVSVPASIKRENMTRKWQAAKDAQFTLFNELTRDVNNKLAEEVNITYDPSQSVEDQHEQLRNEVNRLNLEMGEYLNGDVVDEQVVKDFQQAIEISRSMIGGLKEMGGVIEAAQTGDGTRLKKNDDDRPISKGHNPAFYDLAKNYVNDRFPGSVPNNPRYEKVDENEQMFASDDFDQAEHNPDDPVVQAAYEALKKETLEQWNMIMENGFEIEPYFGKGDVYENSKQMLEDLHGRQRLTFFMTKHPTGGEAGGFGEEGANVLKHPMLEDSGLTINHPAHGEVPLLYNDIFRVVHDFFGHGVESYQFGPRGKLNAWIEHSRMFSPIARAAMTAETRSQNAWQNFGPRMRNEDGKLIRPGEEGYLPLSERGSSDQKAFIPDPKISGVDIQTVDGQIVATEREDSILNRDIYEADQNLGNRFGDENRRVIEEKARRIRQRFPKSEGFAQLPLEVKRNKKGEVKVRFKGGKKYNYSFHQGFQWYKGELKEESQARASRYAQQLVQEYRNLEQKAENGDAQAKEALLNKDWYGEMQQRLNVDFGDMANIMSNLIAATSPQTNIKQNYDQAIEALQLFNEGKYDKMIKEYIEWVNSGKTSDEWRKAGKTLPKKSNGKKYNANSLLVLEALADTFTAKYGQKGSGPKAIYFDRNLSGRGEEPTIDIWMARYFERIISGRVLPRGAEKGVVNGKYTGDGDKITNQYGVASKIVTEAAKEIGITPAQLQAVIWVNEKNLWENNGWTSNEQELFSYEDAIKDQGGLDAYFPGVTTQTGSFRFNDDYSIVVDGEVLSLQDALKNPELFPGVDIIEQVNKNIIEGIPGNQLVTASNNIALGGYDNSFERSSGLTILTKRGFVPFEAAARTFEQAKASNQQSAIFNRVLKHESESENARPGLTVQFSKQLPLEASKIIAESSSRAGFDGFTILQDARTGQVSGVRYLMMPEFDAYWGTRFRDDQDIAEWVEEKTLKREELVKDLSSNIGGLTDFHYIGETFNDPTVAFRENYDERIEQLRSLGERGTGTDGESTRTSAQEDGGTVDGGGTWGQSILSSLEEAYRTGETRDSRDSDSGGTEDTTRLKRGSGRESSSSTRNAQERRVQRNTELTQKFAQDFGGTVTVVTDESQLPENLQGHPDLQDDRVPGFYHQETDTFYIFPDRIHTDAQLAQVLAHEALHQGVRSAFGPELDSTLQGVLNSVRNLPKDHPYKKLLKKIAKKYGIDDLYGSMELAEEFVAEIAENQWYAQRPGTIKGVLDFVKEKFAQMMGSDQYQSLYTDRMLRNIIHKSKTSLRAPIRSARQQGVVRFSINDDDSLKGKAEESIRAGDTLGEFLGNLEDGGAEIDYNEAVEAWKDAQKHSLRNVEELSKIDKKDRPEDYGRKDLANPFEEEQLRDYFDDINEARNEGGIPESRSDAEVHRIATARLNKNYEGEKKRLFQLADGGDIGNWSDIDQRMANIILGREGRKTLANGDTETYEKLQYLVDMNIRQGSAMGRAFRQRQDKVMSPQQRMADDVGTVVTQTSKATESYEVARTVTEDLNKINRDSVSEAITSTSISTGMADVVLEALNMKIAKEKGFDLESQEAVGQEKLMAIDQMKKKIASVIDKHYTEKNKAYYSLYDRFVEELGLEGEVAEDFAIQFENKMSELTQKAKDAYLKRFFSARKKQGKNKDILPADIRKMVKLSNSGVLDHDLWRTAFGDKFLIPNIDDAQAARMRDYLDKLQVQKGKKRNQTLTEFIQYLDTQRVAGGNLDHYFQAALRELTEQVTEVKDSSEDIVEQSKDVRIGLMMSAMLTPSRTDLNKAGEDREARKAVYKEHREKFNQVAEALLKKGIDIKNLTDEDLRDDKVVYGIVRGFQAANSGWSDKFYEYYLNALLSAPATQSVNLTGNLVNFFWEFSAQRFTEGLLNAARGNRVDGPKLGELKHIYTGMFRSLPKAFMNGLRAFDTERSVFAEEINTRNRGTKWQELNEQGVSIDGTKGRIIRLPLRTIMFIDEIFKTLSYHGELSAQAYREATNKGLKGSAISEHIAKRIHKPTNRLNERAWQTALNITFQQEGGAITKSVLSMRSKYPPLRYFLPFVSTPGNLLKTGLRKSPLGAFNVLQKSIRGGINTLVLKDNEFRYKAPEIQRDLAEQTLAWAALGVIASMMSLEDDDGKEKLPFITGSSARFGTSEQRFTDSLTPPYSIRIGDKYYSYKRVEPFSTIIAPSVDLLQEVKQVKQGKDVPAAFMSYLGKVQRMITDKSYLQSLGDVYKAMEDPSYLPSVFQNFATSWMPNIVKHVSMAADDKVRDWRPKETEFPEIFEEFGKRTVQKGTRLLSLLPPPKVDWLGRDVERGSYGNEQIDYLYRLTNPVYLVDKQPAKADLLVLRYNRKYPKEKWFPSRPSPRVSFEGVDYHMSDEEYYTFLKRRGQNLNEFANDFAEDYNRNGGSLKAYIEAFKSAQNEASEIAKWEMYDEGLIDVSKIEEGIQEDIDPWEDEDPPGSL